MKRIVRSRQIRLQTSWGALRPGIYKQGKWETAKTPGSEVPAETRATSSDGVPVAQYDDYYIVEPRGDGKFNYVCNCLVKHGEGIRRCGHVSRSRQGWKVHYKWKHEDR